MFCLANKFAGFKPCAELVCSVGYSIEWAAKSLSSPVEIERLPQIQRNVTQFRYQTAFACLFITVVLLLPAGGFISFYVVMVLSCSGFLTGNSVRSTAMKLQHRDCLRCSADGKVSTCFFLSFTTIITGTPRSYERGTWTPRLLLAFFSSVLSCRPPVKLKPHPWNALGVPLLKCDHHR